MKRLFMILLLFILGIQVLAFDYTIRKEGLTFYFNEKVEKLDYSVQYKMLSEDSEIGTLFVIEDKIKRINFLKEIFPENIPIVYLHGNNFKFIINDRTLKGNEKGEMLNKYFTKSKKGYMESQYFVIAIENNKFRGSGDFSTIHEDIEINIRKAFYELSNKNQSEIVHLNNRWFFEGISNFGIYLYLKENYPEFSKEMIDKAKEYMKKYKQEVTLNKWCLPNERELDEIMKLENKIKGKNSDSVFYGFGPDTKKRIRHYFKRINELSIWGGIDNWEKDWPGDLYYNISFYVFYQLFDKKPDKLKLVLKELKKIADKNKSTIGNEDICSVIKSITGKDIKPWLEKAANIE